MDSINDLFSVTAHLRHMINIQSKRPENQTVTALEITEAKAAYEIVSNCSLNKLQIILTHSQATDHIANLISTLGVHLGAQNVSMVKSPIPSSVVPVMAAKHIASCSTHSMAAAKHITSHSTPAMTPARKTVVCIATAGEHSMTPLVTESTSAVKKLTTNITGVFDGFNEILVSQRPKSYMSRP